MSPEQYKFFITTIEKVMKEIKEIKKDVIDSVELTLINPPDSSGRYEVFITKNDYERLKGDAKLVITDLNGEEHILYKVYTGEGVPYYCCPNMHSIEWGIVEEYSENSAVIRKVTYGIISLATINDLQYKQDVLVNGQNIKSINGESLLGEGNINTDKTITVTGSFDSNYECIIEINIDLYNKLVNEDCVLKFIEISSGYNFLLRKSLQENLSPLVDAIYSGIHTNMSYAGWVQKVVDESDNISYVITFNGFSLANESSLADKQDVLTESSINDGTINKAIGFDSSNNLVKGAVSGGTKLYKHEIEVSGIGSGNKYIVISTESGNLSVSWLASRYGKSILSIVNANGYPYIGSSAASTTNEFYFAKITSGNIVIVTQQYNVTGGSSSTDTVTAL